MNAGDSSFFEPRLALGVGLADAFSSVVSSLALSSFSWFSVLKTSQCQNLDMIKDNISKQLKLKPTLLSLVQIQACLQLPSV